MRGVAKAVLPFHHLKDDAQLAHGSFSAARAGGGKEDRTMVDFFDKILERQNAIIARGKPPVQQDDPDDLVNYHIFILFSN